MGIGALPIIYIGALLGNEIITLSSDSNGVCSDNFNRNLVRGATNASRGAAPAHAG